MTIASRARSRRAIGPASPRVVVSEVHCVYEEINASVAPHHVAESIIVGHFGGHELPLTTAPIAIAAPRANTSRVARTCMRERILMTIAMFTTGRSSHNCQEPTLIEDLRSCASPKGKLR